jgi:hypothetical protein
LGSQSASCPSIWMAPTNRVYARGVRCCPRTIGMYFGGTAITLQVQTISVPTLFATKGPTTMAAGSAANKASRLAKVGTCRPAPLAASLWARIGRSTVIQICPSTSPLNAIIMSSHCVTGIKMGWRVGRCIMTIHPTAVGSAPAVSMMNAWGVLCPYDSIWSVKASGTTPGIASYCPMSAP